MIGIMTYHAAHNYGAVLQAYALLNYVNELDYDCEIVNYISDYFENGYKNGFPLDSIKSLLLNIKHYKKIKLRKKQVELFEDFQRSKLKILNAKTIKDPKDIKFNTVLFGSDQIWSDSAGGGDLAYFGKNVYGNKISYAASYGSSVMSSFQKANIKKYVSEFEYVSLREPSLIDETKELIGKNVNLVVDPVFLLSSKQWSKLIDGSSSNLAANIFLYQLKGSESLSAYCNKKNNVISAHPTCSWIFSVGDMKNDIGPIEFVSYIKNSNYICTDSFHATAFSCIFHKKVIMDKKYCSDSRIASLINLESVALQIVDENLVLIDFENIKTSSLQKMINDSKEYLINALSKCEQKDIKEVM